MVTFGDFCQLLVTFGYFCQILVISNLQRRVSQKWFFNLASQWCLKMYRANKTNFESEDPKTKINRQFWFFGHSAGKWPKNSPTLAEIQNWLKTHPKVANAQNKKRIQHFGGCLHKNDVRISAVGNYQNKCEDLWANISRRAKIF